MHSARCARAPAGVHERPDRMPGGTTGRHRGPRRGREEHAHPPAARRARRARRPRDGRRLPPLRRRRARRARPRRPARPAGRPRRLRARDGACSSRWTAARPPTTCGRAADAHDLVLVDRYVASNAAYGAARLHQGACGEFVAWVHALEIERFGVPVPDRHLLLDVPRAVAARARRAPGADANPGRARDRYESDAGPAGPDRGGLPRAGRGGLAGPVDGARRGRGPRRHRTPATQRSPHDLARARDPR